MRAGLRSWVLIQGAGAVLAAGLLAASAPPAAAQTVEEVVVTGKPKNLPETLSYRVSYADLDLTKGTDGQKELERRIRVAADYICGQLNPGVNANACVVEATRGVKDQVHKAKIRQIKDFANGFKPGASWVAPPGKQ